MKKILVPHDGYEMSDKALKHAIEIAKAMKMEVVLLRVVPYVMNDSGILFMSEELRKRTKRHIAEVNRQIRKEIYNKLSKQLTACNSSGVKAERLAVMGEPAEKILSVARKEDPYMIIMGSRRLKGFGKLRVLGSVARRVSEEAKCPVTIVH